MVTLVGTQLNLVDAIKALLELEYDSVELYTAVIDRLQNEEYASKMSEYRKDHEDHIERITEILEDNNIQFSKGPDGTQIIPISKVALNKMMGNDIDILKVMIPAEEDNIKAYDRMLKYDDLSNKCIEAFRKGFNDEVTHRNWLLSVIEG